MKNPFNLLIKVFNLIKKEPTSFFYMLFFDFILVTVLMLINKVSMAILPQDPSKLEALSNTQLMSISLFIPAYLFLVLIIYSVCKYSILHILSNLISKRKFNIKPGLKFIPLNLILFIIFFVAYLLISYFFMFSVEQENLRIAFTVIIIPFIALSYVLLNTAHMSFIRTSQIKKSIIDAFQFLKKITYIIPLLLLVVLFLSYGLVSLFMDTTTIFNQIIWLILFYVVLAFNRIYFYFITE